MSQATWEELLAANVGRVLTPVQPSDDFRDRLRSNLKLAGRQQAARRAMKTTHTPAYARWWLGAAAFGLVLAGGSVLAYFIRSRQALD
jgi:hypothetical protein